MQTITTRYRGATGTKGARISATSASGLKKSYPYNYALDADANHVSAARQLAIWLNGKNGGYGWDGQWHGGHTRDGMVFVCAGGFCQFSIGGGAK